MTAPPDLPAFLLARLAEREAAARATAADYPPPWRGRELDDEGDSIETGIVFDADHREVVYWEAGDRDAADRLGEHIARHDPARVLADCAAQRAIVELHEHVGSWLSEWDEGDPVPVESGLFGCRICALDDRQIEPEGWCDTLLALAQPWSDHPDFDPAWRA